MHAVWAGYLAESAWAVMGCVLGEGREVGIGVRDRSVRADCDRGDEAVDELAYGRTVATACAVARGDLVVVLGDDVYERRPGEQAAQLGEVLFIAGVVEYLRADRVADREVAPVLWFRPHRISGP